MNVHSLSERLMVSLMVLVSLLLFATVTSLVTNELRGLVQDLSEGKTKVSPHKTHPFYIPVLYSRAKPR